MKVTMEIEDTIPEQPLNLIEFNDAVIKQMKDIGYVVKFISVSK